MSMLSYFEILNLEGKILIDFIFKMDLYHAINEYYSYEYPSLITADQVGD